MFYKLTGLPPGHNWDTVKPETTKKPAPWKLEWVGGREVRSIGDALSTELPWREHWV